MIDDGRIVNQFETENWSYVIKEVDNYITVSIGGKRDHRDRVIWYQQSRRLFPEIRDEDDEN
jgi:hypothetical protein